MRVLVHICCGPCAITPLQELLDEGHSLMGLFVNPNIHPLTEYLRRRDGAVEVCARLGVKLVVRDADYDPVTFLRNTAWREDNRCLFCYAMRLERAARIARSGDFDAFTSTMLYSRKQKHDHIRQVGESLGAGEGPAFLYRDFRPGWERGFALSTAWGIHRQQYCGCIYSELERYRKELNR